MWVLKFRLPSHSVRMCMCLYCEANPFSQHVMTSTSPTFLAQMARWVDYTSQPRQAGSKVDHADSHKGGSVMSMDD